MESVLILRLTFDRILQWHNLGLEIYFVGVLMLQIKCNNGLNSNMGIQIIYFLLGEVWLVFFEELVHFLGIVEFMCAESFTAFPYFAVCRVCSAIPSFVPVTGNFCLLSYSLSLIRYVIFRYFRLFCGFSNYFLDSVLWSWKVFNFDEFQLTYFSLIACL